MKNILLLTVISAVLSLEAQNSISSLPYIGGANQPGKISVAGNSTVNVEPDRILIYFGAETNDMDLMTSRDNVKSIVDLAKKTILNLGVEERYFKTDYIDVMPRYDDRYRKEERFLGYYSRYGFVVTVLNKDMLEEVLMAALKSGVNYVHGVEFQTTELRKYRDQARSIAIKAAKEKAVALTQNLGVKIGLPTSIRENNIGNWYRSSSNWNNSRSGYLTQNVVQEVRSSTEEANFGMIAVQSEIAVTFELLPFDDEAEQVAGGNAAR